MDIKNREEDRNSFARSFQILGLDSFAYIVNGPMRGSHNHTLFIRNTGSRIPKKVKGKCQECEPESKNDSRSSYEKRGEQLSEKSSQNYRKKQNNQFPEHPASGCFCLACMLIK